jgi:tetratricopeptide (TPR) repeat protein/capsular polysaccharide biosynthesis protein
MPATSQLDLSQLHYNLGHVLHQQGDLASAVQSYQQAIDLRPDYIDAHLNLAIVLDEQGRFEAAIDHYRRVIALQPDAVQAHNNLGCTLAKLKELDAAIQSYQRAIDLQPDWATPYNNLGQALANQGKSAEAIEAYQRAIELQPDLGLAHANLGKLLQSQGYHAQAIACFQQVTQLDPNCLSAYSDCAISWLAQGKLEHALPYLRQVIAHQSNFVEAYCQWTAQLGVQQHGEGGDRNQNQNNPIEQDQLTQAQIACGRFLHTLHHHPDAPVLKDYLAQTYFHLGQTLYLYGGDGQYRQAQTYYQFVLQLQPNHMEAYLGLGNCLVKLGKQNAAIWVYHRALATCPNPVPLHVQLGQTLEQQGKFAEAIVHYQQALQGQQLGKRTGTRVRESKGEREFETSDLLPQGVYPSTQDWIASTPFLSTHYIRLQLSRLRLDISAEGSPPPFSPISPPSLSSPPSSCQGLNCPPCLKQLFDRFTPTHLGKGIYSFALTHKGVDEGGTQTPLFVATIAKGRVWTVPQHTHWQICNAIAVLTPDNYLLADLSRDYPGQLPNCQQPHPTPHSIFKQESLPVREQIDGTVAVLTGLSGHNYYHWLVDVLPRWALLQASGLDLTQVDWFLVNNLNHPFQRATLAALNIPLEKVIASDRHSYLQAKQLVVPSFASALGWPEPWGLEFLRQQFLPLAERASLPTPYPERIYISRNRASHRRVLNEPAVIEQLESYGFVAIQLETLSFVDQVALFANARTIVTPHGGGLTNIIFCRAETIVIELVNVHYIRHYYLVISQQLQLQHYLIVGERFTCYPLRQLMYPSPLMEDIWVNLDSLTHLLQTLS